MRETPQTAVHADDGDLVRFLDQQVSMDQRRWLYAHLAECGECARRMETLREQASVLSSLVETLDSAAPDALTRARALAAVRRAGASRTSSRRWYAAGSVRAAAMVAVAALATLGVEPVRAWVSERLSELVGADDAVPAVAVRPPVVERGSIVSFEPAGETFVLEIEHAQEMGYVSLELREVTEASAEVVDGRTEEILALPSGLRVANSSTSRASYRLVLPTDLKLIQVFAGGRPVAIIPVEDVQHPWSRTVSLNPADLNR